ncbi:hypothetical protein [Nitrosomonas mobilis]|uniref:hypothetical protein n=1 Tax=Nitrosomonas mobilis TaxID=51642 RepID=UPI0015A26E04
MPNPVQLAFAGRHPESAGDLQHLHLNEALREQVFVLLENGMASSARQKIGFL